ncbi:hypothetical protein [Aquabacterium sp.]|uniref:hypothetical protein n=1 Tax=Aquabacterium sp. TaxID=1872578 RepID=UPI0019CDD00E|nr:hypothetical protein [Aquabacterium sp.]MBC7701692.1 hypothetical protein [Aquabacterium sp.]
MKKSWWSIGAWTLSIVGCLALVACSPALDWRSVRPEHAPALQAVFPCKPKQVDRSLTLPALPGPPVTMHLVSCKVGESIWALSYFDAQEITRVPLALAADNRALRDNLEAVSRLGSPPAVATVSAEDLGPAQVIGMTPNALSRHWRLVGRRPAGNGESAPVEVHAWHFSHGLMVYQASLWRPMPPASAKDSTDSVETFIQGFKFSD